MQELVKLATGVALVMREAVAAAPPLRSLRDGDLGGVATATVKGLIDVAADVTGLTRGRVHQYRRSQMRSTVGQASQSATIHRPLESAASARPEEGMAYGGSNIRDQQEQELTEQRVRSSAAATISGRNSEAGVSPLGTRPTRLARDDVSGVKAHPDAREVRIKSDLAKETSKEAGSLSAREADQEPKLEEASRDVGVGAPLARRKRKPRERHVPATPFGRVLGYVIEHVHGVAKCWLLGNISSRPGLFLQWVCPCLTCSSLQYFLSRSYHQVCRTGSRTGLGDCSGVGQEDLARSRNQQRWSFALSVHE